MKNIFLTILLITALSVFESLNAQTKNMEIQIDVNSVTHQMKGGIGASWHALIHEMPFENSKYDYPARLVGPRGSGFAGNPH